MFDEIRARRPKTEFDARLTLEQVEVAADRPWVVEGQQAWGRRTS